MSLIDASTCAFCKLTPSRILAESPLAIVVRDKFPVSPGHTLIIPRRHVGSFFELADDERTGLLSLLISARAQLEIELRPDGYNIGINDGAAAGQTVPHVHLHIIPRYRGDLTDPRGGIRWIFPGKADYWSPE